MHSIARRCMCNATPPPLPSLHSIYLSNHTPLCLRIYSRSVFGMYRVFIMRKRGTSSLSLAFSRHIPSLSFLSVNAFCGVIKSQWRIEYRLADWLYDSDSGLGPPWLPHTHTHIFLTIHCYVRQSATGFELSITYFTDATHDHTRHGIYSLSLQHDSTIHKHTHTHTLIMEAQHHLSHWYSFPAFQSEGTMQVWIGNKCLGILHKFVAAL